MTVKKIITRSEILFANKCRFPVYLPMLSPDSIDNTAKSKADSERKQGVNDKI
jgi:hypothetical protein